MLDSKAGTKTRDVRKIAAAIANSKIGYCDITSVLDALMSSLGKKYKVKAKKHPSFIEGRTASVFFGKKEAGIIGEIHPSVLENWNLKMPVVAFEIDLDML